MLFFLPGPHSIHIRNLNCVVWSNNRLIFIFLWYLTSLPHSQYISLSLSVSIANTLYGDEAGGFDEATQLFNRIFNTFLFNITEQWFQLIVDDKFLATFDWFTSKKQNHHEISSNEVNGKCVCLCMCVLFFLITNHRSMAANIHNSIMETLCAQCYCFVLLLFSAHFHFIWTCCCCYNSDRHSFSW